MTLTRVGVVVVVVVFVVVVMFASMGHTLPRSSPAVNSFFIPF